MPSSCNVSVSSRPVFSRAFAGTRIYIKFCIFRLKEWNTRGLFPPCPHFFCWADLSFRHTSSTMTVPSRFFTDFCGAGMPVCHPLHISDFLSVTKMILFWFVWRGKEARHVKCVIFPLNWTSIRGKRFNWSCVWSPTTIFLYILQTHYFSSSSSFCISMNIKYWILLHSHIYVIYSQWLCMRLFLLKN